MSLNNLFFFFSRDTATSNSEYVNADLHPLRLLDLYLLKNNNNNNISLPLFQIITGRRNHSFNCSSQIKKLHLSSVVKIAPCVG